MRKKKAPFNTNKKNFGNRKPGTNYDTDNDGIDTEGEERKKKMYAS